MKRRAFIAGLGSAAAWPLVARGQQPTMPVVGFISPRTYEADLAAFRRGLNEAGYIEGKNVTVDIRWLEGKSDLAPSIVTDLVARQVSAIRLYNRWGARGQGENLDDSDRIRNRRRSGRAWPRLQPQPT